MASESAEVIALCRLAERQGLLTGDLSHLQRLALLAVTQADAKEAAEREVQRFKTAALAANLALADKLMEMFERVERSGPSVQFTAKEEIRPLTANDKQQMLKELRAFGIG